MKRALTVMALAGACALAGCDDDQQPGGWYAAMTCQQRDLPTGRCTQATYSCTSELHQLVYYRVGPRCYLRGAK